MDKFVHWIDQLTLAEKGGKNLFLNLFMDYEKYVEASMDEKKSMIVKNVVDSVKAIKTKGKIDFNHFKEDMMSFCEVSGINYY